MGETPHTVLASLRRQEHSGEPEILQDIKYLLEKGADLLKKNHNAKNARMSAMENEKYIVDQPVSIYFSKERISLDKFIIKNKRLKLI